jgi:hypothetical protein
MKESLHFAGLPWRIPAQCNSAPSRTPRPESRDTPATGEGTVTGSHAQWRCCSCCDRVGSRQTAAMRTRRPRSAAVARSAFAGFCFPPEVIGWRCAGTYASRCRTATSRSCWPNVAWRSTTSPSTGGCSGSRRCWPRRPGPAAMLSATARSPCLVLDHPHWELSPGKLPPLRDVGVPLSSIETRR